MKQRHRFGLATMVTLLAIVFTSLFGGGQAFASGTSPDTIHITGLGSPTVNLRASADTNGPIVGQLPDGANPEYICYKRGQRVGGAGDLGTAMWFKVRWNGTTGYYTSFYDNVPLEWQTGAGIQEHYGLPNCGSMVSQKANKAPSPSQPTPADRPTVHYDGNAAAKYALDHATDRQMVFYPGCTEFASNALRAGGLKETAEWNSSGMDMPRMASGTPAWRAADMLHPYLVNNGLATEDDLQDELHTNKVENVRPGDLIAYDWVKEGQEDPFRADHFAVVTNVTADGYPEVSEWGTVRVLDFARLKNHIDYQKRGWTWSAINGKWLQEENTSMRAVLLRVGR